MRSTTVRLVLAAMAFHAGLSACASESNTASPSTFTSPTAPTTTSPNCPTAGLATTVPYTAIAGVPADSLSLDIHAPTVPTCDAPIVMWVHGGGYQSGDKSNQIADKITLFNGQGWILVSVNYRLTVPGDPNSAQFPDHYNDVAASVAWVHDNIARWGGDPDRVALLGHSAGADIVANVITNPVYLSATGLDLSAIQCAGPLDTEGFDKEAAGDERSQWVAALGNNPNYLTETSATKLATATATAGVGIPGTIGVYRGSALRQRIELEFLDTLDSLGVATVRIDARSLTHSQVNSRIGASGDTVMTAPLVAFLEACFTD